MERHKSVLRNLALGGFSLTLAVVMLCLLLSITASWAQGPDEEVSSATVQPLPAGDVTSLGDGDDDVLAGPEVGVEYTGIPWWDTTAKNLYNSLGRGGWTKRFIYGGRWAWEEDFKVWWRGGTEHIYVDTVDLAFFHGHGGSSWDSVYGRPLCGPWFGHNHCHDDAYLVPGDAYKAWGNNDLEWMAMKGCKILNDTSRRYWANAMNRLHLILGFKTNSYSTWWGSFGSRFARYIRWGWTLPQAWFRATDDTQPHHSVIARVLAEERCHFDDRWYRSCGDRYPNGWYWYWDHRAGSEPARLVEPADLDYKMPIYNVQPGYLTTDELDELAQAFGLGGVPATLEDEDQVYRITSDALDLTVDQQGLYSFINLDRLWSVTDTMTSGVTVLSADDARDIAHTFLVSNSLLPTDAQYYEVAPEELSEAGITEVISTTTVSLGMTDAFTDVQETISSTTVTAWQVIYSRILTYTPTGGDLVEFSVQGPGAKIKVYVSHDSQVIGAMGGWRTLDDVATLDTVDIITPAQMTLLFEQLGLLVNLAPTLYNADVVTMTSSTVGYYEHGSGVEQTSLIPAYILELEMGDTTSGDVLTSTAFVPAAPSLMNPLAAITTYIETEPIISVGQVLTLTAADASQPLSVLGYGDSLNFVLGQGPYTYTWRLETTEIVIGTGRTITYPAGIVDDLGVNKDNDVPMVIVLEVTDATGRTSAVAQHFYFIETTPEVKRMYLPVVSRMQ